MAAHQELFDSRIVERNLAKGLITREEYDAYLASLEDLEAQALPVESKFEANVLEQDDEDVFDAGEEE